MCIAPFTCTGGIPCEVPGSNPTSPLTTVGPLLEIEAVAITAKLEAEPRLMMAWPVPTVVLVVKFQGFGTPPVASGWPDRSFTIFEIVAVYCAWLARLVEGTKVAMWLAES